MLTYTYILGFSHLYQYSLSIDDVDFMPSFADSLYFVPLGKKADSRLAVKKTLNDPLDKSLVRKISEMSEKVLELKSL